MKDLFEQALKEEGITGQLADVARSIYMQESSGGTNTKTSNAGARGGMQIMPGTFKEVADKGWNIDDPLQNARAGIRYLSKLDKMSGGDPALTAAGYYGGPGGMRKAREGIAVSDPRNPNAPNTLQYGQEVVARMQGNKPPVQAPVVQNKPPVPVAQKPGLINQLGGYGRSIGPHWEASNKRFEETNPNVVQRVGRALNPATGFGSALGSMHTAAGNGDKMGMALAAAESVPLFGSLKVAGKSAFEIAQAFNVGRLAKGAGLQTGTSLSNDAYGNAQDPMQPMHQAMPVQPINPMGMNYGQQMNGMAQNMVPDFRAFKSWGARA